MLIQTFILNKIFHWKFVWYIVLSSILNATNFILSWTRLVKLSITTGFRKPKAEPCWITGFLSRLVEVEHELNKGYQILFHFSTILLFPNRNILEIIETYKSRNFWTRQYELLWFQYSVPLLKKCCLWCSLTT